MKVAQSFYYVISLFYIRQISHRHLSLFSESLSARILVHSRHLYHGSKHYYNIIYSNHIKLYIADQNIFGSCTHIAIYWILEVCLFIDKDEMILNLCTWYFTKQATATKKMVTSTCVGVHIKWGQFQVYFRLILCLCMPYLELIGPL